MNNNSLITVDSSKLFEIEHLIVFSLVSKEYAINIKNILEVINIQDVEISSKTPKGVIGMLNYNGVMIKVIDICPFLGFETPKFSINDKFIITIFNDSCFAVRIQDKINIISVNKTDLQNIPYNTENSIIKEIYTNDNNTVNIINIEALNNILSNVNQEENNINYPILFPDDEKSKQMLTLRTNNITYKEAFAFPLNINYQNQFILFTLGQHNYYIDLQYVKEFISVKRLNITKLPYTENYIKGIINSKGDILVVIDLKCFLNNDSDTDKENGKLIITKGKNFNIAFLVDDIKYIKNLKDIEKIPTYSGNSKYITAEFSEDDEIFSILNYEKIINDERIYIDIN